MMLHFQAQPSVCQNCHAKQGSKRQAAGGKRADKAAAAHLPGCTKHMTAVDPESEKSAPVEARVDAAAAKQRSNSCAASSCCAVAAEVKDWLWPGPEVALTWLLPPTLLLLLPPLMLLLSLLAVVLLLSMLEAAAVGWHAGCAMEASWLCMSRPDAKALRKCAEAAAPALPCPSNTPTATAGEQQVSVSVLVQPWLVAAPAASGSARKESWLHPFQLRRCQPPRETTATSASPGTTSLASMSKLEAGLAEAALSHAAITAAACCASVRGCCGIAAVSWLSSQSDTLWRLPDCTTPSIREAARVWCSTQLTV